MGSFIFEVKTSWTEIYLVSVFGKGLMWREEVFNSNGVGTNTIRNQAGHQ